MLLMKTRVFGNMPYRLVVTDVSEVVVASVLTVYHPFLD